MLLQRAVWGVYSNGRLQQRHHVVSVSVAFRRHGHQLVWLRENDHRVCGAWKDTDNIFIVTNSKTPLPEMVRTRAEEGQWLHWTEDVGDVAVR